MNWAAINAVSEVIGTVAIIGTLIYVAVQIRQNTSIARATIIHGTNSDAMRLSECIAMDAELAAIYQKGTNGESLSGTDLVRYLALLEMHLAWFEDVDGQAEANLFFQDDEMRDVVKFCQANIKHYSRHLRLVNGGTTT